MHGAHLDAVLKLVSRVIGAFAQQFAENDNLLEQEDPALFASRQDASVLLPNAEGLLLKQLSLRRQFSLQHAHKDGRSFTCSGFNPAPFNPGAGVPRIPAGVPGSSCRCSVSAPVTSAPELSAQTDAHSYGVKYGDGLLLMLPP